jgi:hypothetical protein
MAPGGIASRVGFLDLVTKGTVPLITHLLEICFTRGSILLHEPAGETYILAPFSGSSTFRILALRVPVSGLTAGS